MDGDFLGLRQAELAQGISGKCNCGIHLQLNVGTLFHSRSFSNVPGDSNPLRVKTHFLRVQRMPIVGLLNGCLVYLPRFVPQIVCNVEFFPSDISTVGLHNHPFLDSRRQSDVRLVRYPRILKPYCQKNPFIVDVAKLKPRFQPPKMRTSEWICLT